MAKDGTKLGQQIEQNKGLIADRWVWHTFFHPSRPEQSGILSHWVKDKEKNDTYPFSKFNRSIEVIDFSEAEYKDVIQKMPRDGRKAIWSKGDTRLLFQLCEQFKLKFIPITDRFNFAKQEEMQKLEKQKA